MVLDIEKRFASIKDNGDLLRPITPDMDPEESIARLQEFNRRDVTPEMVQHRRDHLRQAGVEDWETWTFYSLPPFSTTQDESLDFLRENWPSRIESLLVPGQWGGGGGVTEAHTGNVRIVGMSGPAKFSPEGHTIYLRVAPQRK